MRFARLREGKRTSTVERKINGELRTASSAQGFGGKSTWAIPGSVESGFGSEGRHGRTMLDWGQITEGLCQPVRSIGSNTSSS